MCCYLHGKAFAHGFDAQPVQRYACFDSFYLVILRYVLWDLVCGDSSTLCICLGGLTGS